MITLHRLRSGRDTKLTLISFFMWRSTCWTRLSRAPGFLPSQVCRSPYVILGDLCVIGNSYTKRSLAPGNMAPPPACLWCWIHYGLIHRRKWYLMYIAIPWGLTALLSRGYDCLLGCSSAAMRGFIILSGPGLQPGRG